MSTKKKDLVTSAERYLPKDFLGQTGMGDSPLKAPSSISVNSPLNEILLFARDQDASDIHLSVNNPILFRKYTTLLPQTDEKLIHDHTHNCIKSALTEEQLSEFDDYGDFEFVYVLEGAGRYRVTLIKQRFGWDFTARLIPMEIRSFEDSGMPPSCKDLTKWAQGLVLITGPAGCGKTSSLSTLVDAVNASRCEHIITIENPIEVPFTPKKCRITQREINRHTLSQANALRAALREDPDILVVSELRDLESIQLAVTAAETGHLVFATMNTNNAVQTISSLIDSFPPEERSIITNMISESLRGVISQQLIPKMDSSGVAVAYEVLVVNSAIANIIREHKMEQIHNSMSTGRAIGMVLLDNSLSQLVKEGTIDSTEAQARAINPNNFSQYT